jgi:carboxymethylenebutenolidase
MTITLNRTLAIRCLTALAALALLAAPLRAEEKDREPKVEKAEFQSGGKAITVEISTPAKPGKYPVLVILHAVDGIEGDWAVLYRALCKEYSSRGYVVVLAHLFDRTDPKKTDRAAYRDLFVNHFSGKELCEKDAKRRKQLFAEWVECVRDTVAYARSRPEVNGERVALVGFSLGACLALSAATEHDLKLAALVEVCGALPVEYRPHVKCMPPTLVLHGDADKVIPVEQAYLIAGLFLARKQCPDVEIVAGAEHMFLKDGKEVQWLKLAEAKKRATAFLDKHLK